MKLSIGMGSGTRTTCVSSMPMNTAFVVCLANAIVIATGFLIDSFPDHCNRSISCLWHSTDGDFLENYDLLNYPFLRIVNDSNPKCNLMRYFDSSSFYAYEDIKLRKIVCNNRLYVHPQNSFVSYEMSLIDPVISDGLDVYDADIDSFQACIETYCYRNRKLFGNRRGGWKHLNLAIPVFKCHHLRRAKFLFQLRGNVTETCVEQISYLDFRNSTFSAYSMNTNRFRNALTLNLQCGGHFRHPTIWQNVVPKLVLVKISYPIKFGVVRRLVAHLGNLAEISTPKFYFWPHSSYKIEIFDRKTQCFRTINARGESDDNDDDKDDDDDDKDKDMLCFRNESLEKRATMNTLTLSKSGNSRRGRSLFDDSLIDRMCVQVIIALIFALLIVIVMLLIKVCRQRFFCFV